MINITTKQNIIARTRLYIRDVYLTLLLHFISFTISCYIGSYIRFYYHGRVIMMSFIMSLLCIFGMTLTNTRKVCSCLVPIFTGLMMSPIIKVLIWIDPDIIIIAGLLSIVIFGTLTFTAFYSFEKINGLCDYSMNKSIMISILNITIAFGLLNTIFDLSVLHMIELYVSFIIFSLFVIFDTKIMINRANSRIIRSEENGNDNRELYVHIDALMLFLDIANIIIRILLMLKPKNKN